MLLSPAVFGVPQVSYAMRAPCSAPPRFIGNGEGRSMKRVPGGMYSVMCASLAGGCFRTSRASVCGAL